MSTDTIAVTLTTKGGEEFDASIDPDLAKGSFEFDGLSCEVLGDGLIPLSMTARAPEALLHRYRALRSEIARQREARETDGVRSGEVPPSVEVKIADRTAQEFVSQTARGNATRMIKRKTLEKSLAEMPPVESLDAFMARELETGQPLLTDPWGNALLRRGEKGRIVGGDKAGKSVLVGRELVYSLVSGADFLGFYEVEPLADDECVVVLDAENDEADRQQQWAHLATLMKPEERARIIHVPLAGIVSDVYDPGWRESVMERCREQIDGRRIGLVVMDSLVSIGSLGKEGLYDAKYAVDLNVEVMGWFKAEWDAQTFMVLIHTPRYMDDDGTDVKPTGGPHWDQQLSPHWVYHYEPKSRRRGARMFEVTPGRGGTKTPAQYVLLDEHTGRLYVDTTRTEEAADVARTQGASKAAVRKEEKEIATRLFKTTEILNYIKAENAKGAYPDAGEVATRVVGNAALIGKVLKDMLAGDSPLVRNRNVGTAEKRWALEAVTAAPIPGTED